VPIDTGFDPAGPSARSAGWQDHDRPGGRGTDGRDTMTVHGCRDVRTATITINPPPE